MVETVRFNIAIEFDIVEPFVIGRANKNLETSNALRDVQALRFAEVTEGGALSAVGG